MFLTRLSVMIRSGCSLEDYKKYGLEQIEASDEEVKENPQHDMKYQGFITSILKDRDLLLILDNTEDPLEYDTIRFTSELNYRK